MPARALAITQRLIDSQRTILDLGAVCAEASDVLGRHGEHALTRATANLLRKSHIVRIGGAGDQLVSVLALVRANGHRVPCAADARSAAA